MFNTERLNLGATEGFIVPEKPPVAAHSEIIKVAYLSGFTAGVSYIIL